MSSWLCLNAGTAFPIEIILLKIVFSVRLIYETCFILDGIYLLLHDLHGNKPQVGAGGSDYIHTHGMFIICFRFVFPDLGSPY